MGIDWKIIVAILAPFITAAGAYFIARRTTSGSVNTSEAAVLWAQSQEMRKELRDEVVRLRTELNTAQIQLIEANKHIEKLTKRVRILEKHDDKQ